MRLRSLRQRTARHLKPPEDSIYALARAEAGRPGIFRISRNLHERAPCHIPADGLVVALAWRCACQGRSPSRSGRLSSSPMVLCRAEWTDHAVTHGLLAGPRLLEDGKIQVTAKAERLDSLKSRDRVALAVKPNGDAILVWAHKNSPGNLSFEQVAQMLMKMGAEEAIALDGGKSRAILAQAGDCQCGRALLRRRPPGLQRACFGCYPCPPIPKTENQSERSDAPDAVGIAFEADFSNDGRAGGIP